MLQQQETLYFGYRNVRSQVEFQISKLSKSNQLCRQGGHVRIDALAPISSGHELYPTTLSLRFDP